MGHLRYSKGASDKLVESRVLWSTFSYRFYRIKIRIVRSREEDVVWRDH